MNTCIKRIIFENNWDIDRISKYLYSAKYQGVLIKENGNMVYKIRDIDVKKGLVLEGDKKNPGVTYVIQ